jgi:uncharacterized damage-inducible protein DinB
MDIHEILKTGTRAQELLYSVVKEHPDLAQKEIETISAFKSISDQLAHCIGAEKRWQMRIGSSHGVINYEEQNIRDVNALHQVWISTRDETMQLLNDGSAELLAKSIDVKLIKWNLEVKMTVEQILYHIAAHESYHRGQCSFLLQMFGVDPPNFDLPFMLD